MDNLSGYSIEAFDQGDVRIYFGPRSGEDAGDGLLFLDRDGIINEDVGYVGSVERVRLLPGIRDALLSCRRDGLKLAIVTNQSGIGRGYYGWEDFESVCAHIARAVLAEGDSFSAIAACGSLPSPHAAAIWRKPGPAMIDRICVRLGIDRGQSWLVGDRQADILAAERSGLRGAVLIGQTGEASLDRSGAARGFAVHASAEAAAAIRFAARKMRDGWVRPDPVP